MMARPLKDGVDYFPKDTGFYEDDKIRLLRAEFGAKGMYLLDYLLCDLYSKNGYYIQWDKSKCFLVSDGAGCGCSPEFVSEFVAGCIRCGLFDNTVFDVFGILTSAGIQRRFIRMLQSREKFTFIEEYFLLDKFDTKDCPQGILNKCVFKKVSNKENSVICTENPINNTDNEQNKIEENKINHIILNQKEHIHKPFGKFGHVLLTDYEYDFLLERDNDLMILINALDSYIEDSGAEYSSHFSVLNEMIKNGRCKDE